MENTKKLTGKDLINVGSYTAMDPRLFSLLSVCLSHLLWSTRFLFIIWPIVCGFL